MTIWNKLLADHAYDDFSPFMPAAEHLLPLWPPLWRLAAAARGTVEVIPAGDGACVLVGDATTRRQLFWVTPAVALPLAEVGTATERRVREACQRATWALRHPVSIAGRAVMIAQSPPLAEEIDVIMGAALAPAVGSAEGTGTPR